MHEKVVIIRGGRKVGPMSRRWAEMIFLPALGDDARVVNCQEILDSYPEAAPARAGLVAIVGQWQRIGLLACGLNRTHSHG
jgi:hypothetical protein